MANRHGLIAGATGTDKTVTLQVLAEAFSRIGVLVFAADVKGDLSGISQPGASNPKIDARIKQLQLGDFQFSPNPVTFWDVFGQQGHPVRATTSEMGPLLFSRLLNLNDTQAAVLTLTLKIADDPALVARSQRPAGHATAWFAENRSAGGAASAEASGEPDRHHSSI